LFKPNGKNNISKLSIKLVHGGTTGSASDQQSEGCGFEAY